ncbi:MAG: glycerol-3-phosphate 1-O-acyltransferase PlsY [Crocinitomicaceae bacterium]|nr:glycerol-3-phosphate 1-O-acyltransferase PlsY [Crocinitomicaceae bacterium]
MIETYLTSGLLAYLLGSVPTAVWVGKAFYGVDVRNEGSKNAGATNTFRVLGKKPGIIVLVIDILKGVIAVLLPLFIFSLQSDSLLYGNIKVLCGIMAVVGHIFPVFAGFNGGKGVATSLGVVIGISPPAAAICITLFLIVFIASQFVSLGAIIASIAFPLTIIFVLKEDNQILIVFSVVLAIAVILAHRKNITRLLAGNENKMNLFKKKS